MERFLQLPTAQRARACQQAAAQLGWPSASIEKDLWVSLMLREVFALPRHSDHLTFKGGTSLSKAWQLIDRFSEDIDLTLDRDALGFGDAAAPEKARSNKERRRRLDALADACRRGALRIDAIEPRSRQRLDPLLAGRHGLEVGVDGRCCCAFPSVAAAEPLAWSDELFAERDAEQRARATRCVADLCAWLHDALLPGEHADVYPVWSDDEAEPSLGSIALRIDAVDVDRLCFVERFVHEFAR